MQPKILKLAPSGVPIRWISLEDAAAKIFKEQHSNSVLWTLGDGAFKMRGGFNSLTGKRSVIDIPAIIAVSEAGSKGNNPMFAGFSADICKHREGMRCAYCGNSFNRSSLTLDHIIPKSKGGPLTMDNIVASCLPCNNRKADRTPEEANMPLLMKPFVPTMAEVMYMKGLSHMTDVQKEYLQAQFKHGELRNYFLNDFENEVLIKTNVA